MSDESIWKKEVSFSRKSEPAEEQPANEQSPPEAEVDSEPGATAEPEEGSDRGLTPEGSDPSSWSQATGQDLTPQASVPEASTKETLWKREVSLEHEPEATAEPPEGSEPSSWTQTPSAGLTPEESGPEASSTETLWKRELSLTPAPEQPVVEEPVAEAEPVNESEPETPVVDEPIAAEADPVVADVEMAQLEPWDAEPELPPAPEPVVLHPPVPVAELPEPAPEEPKVPFWKKDISFGGKKGEKVAKAEKVVASAPDEPKVPFWKKDLSFGGKKTEKPAKAEKVVVSAPDEPKVPFWKKDMSFGGKKRERAPKPQPPAPIASTADAPTVETPAAKVPFWKKDLSFGGKKGKAPKAEREPKAPKAPKAPKVKRPRLNLELGSKSAKNFVGLKIGASQLAAAKVANNGTAELQQVARGPLEAGIVVGGELRDPEALSEALKHFFAAHGLPKRGVRLGIANNRIGVRTFEITGVQDPKQLANAVRFRAQESLPIPIEEAVLDYQVLSEGVTEEGESTRRILLVIAYRELIDRYVDACKKAGITLTGIDLEAFALLRALHAPQDGVEGDPTAALVAVAIGHDRATFAVSDGRVCEFTRVLDWGGSALNVAIARVLDAAPSEVEGWKRALALTDEMVPDGLTSDQAQRAREAMRRAIQAFARELVSSLQYYQNQPGSLGIGEIVLTGGTAHLPGLAGELERMIGVRVRVGDPLARMKISKRVGEPEQVGSLAVAIGLGIED